MVKQIQKVIVLVTVTLMVFTLLSGCSSSGSKEGPARSSTPDRNSISEASGTDELKSLPDPATLTIIMYNNYPPYANKEKVIEEIEARARKALNIEIEMKTINAELSPDILEKLVNSGNPCDIIMLEDRKHLMSYWSANSFYFESDIFKKLATKDVFLDLTDRFPLYAPSYYSKFTEDELASVRYDGKLLAIPRHMPQTGKFFVHVNTLLAEKYSIERIDTPEQLEEYFYLIKKKEPAFTPLSRRSVSTEIFMDYFGYIPVDGVFVYKQGDLDMKLIPWEQTNEYRLAFNLLKKWTAEGLVSTSEDEDITAVFDINNFNYSMQWTARQSSMVKILPLWQGKTSFLSSAFRPSLAISKNSPNAERAMKFIEWLVSSQENYDLLKLGLEGKDYRLDGDAIASKGRYDLVQSGFENIDWERGMVQGVPDYKSFYMNNVLANSYYPPHTGFRPDEKLQKLLDKREAVYYKHFFSQMAYTYTFDFNDDEFQKRMKELRTEEIRKELQRQFDEWRETQQ